MEEEKIINELEEKIEKTKKMPPELENKLNKKILENILMAIAIMMYFISLIFGNKHIEEINYINLLIYFIILHILTINNK